MSADHTRLSEQLKALADPTRLRILSILPATRKCELVCNVSELAGELGVPQPTVSHHLKVLYQAGIVRCEKMCRDVYYWIDDEVAGSVLGAVGGIAKLPAVGAKAQASAKAR